MPKLIKTPKKFIDGSAHEKLNKYLELVKIFSRRFQKNIFAQKIGKYLEKSQYNLIDV